jgi:hypothetical protein
MKHIKFHKSKQMDFKFWCDEKRISLDDFLVQPNISIFSIHMTDNDGGERIHIFYDELLEI